MRRILLALAFITLAGNAWADGTIDTLSAGSALGGTELLPMFQTSNPAVTTTPSALATYITGKTNTWSAVQTVNNGDLALVGTSTGKTTLNSGLAGAGNNTLTLPITATDTLAALATAETWTAVQTITNGDLALLGTSTGKTTLNSGLTSSSNNTLTLPITATDTLAALGTAETWTAAQSFTDGDLLLKGSSTGSTTLHSALASSGNSSWTFPVTTTDTVAGLGTAQTFSAANAFTSTVTISNTDLRLLGTSTGYTTLNSGLSSSSNNTLTLPTTSSDTLAALGTAETWTAVQTVTNGDLALLGTSTGKTTLNSGLTSSSNNTLTLPITASDTLAGIGTAQTWTAVQTFTNSDVRLLGSSTGYTIFTSDNSSSTNYTLHFPAANDTIDLLGTAQSITAAKTFINNDILLLGSSTGATTFNSLNSSSTAYIVSFPANTGTIAELNLAQTFSATQTFNTIGGYLANAVAAVVSSHACTLTGSGSAGCSAATNAIGDCGTFIVFNDSSEDTVTLPNNAPVGCQVAMTQNGTADVKVTAASGATLELPHSFAGKTAGQYSTIGVTVESNSGGSSAVYKFTGDGA